MRRILRQWGVSGLVALGAVLIASALALTVVRSAMVAPPPRAAAVAPSATAGLPSAAPSPAAPAPSARPASAAPLPVGVERTNGITYYTVQPFDVGRREGTLAYIAARFNTTVAQLVEWNHISDPNLIHPGQRLRVS